MRIPSGADAAVVYISGQSNAHAHHQEVPEAERIAAPLRRVFGLDRRENQRLDLSRVTWSGYTGRGKNLGETQDDTACFAYWLARLWERAGDALPPLHIVQISVGSQGLCNGMWNRDLPPRLIPGPLGTADISLYPLALRVFGLVRDDLSARFRAPAALGWHWIGSEEDAAPDFCGRADLPERYDAFFDAMRAAIGFPCPTYLYRLLYAPLSPEYAPGVRAVNAIFERESARGGGAVRIVGADEAPFWDEADERLGVFSADGVHYAARTQRWFAERFFRETTGLGPKP